MPELMLRPVRIRNYLSLMQAMGVRGAQVLAGTGIDARRIDNDDYLIEASQCRAVISNMILLGGDLGIGLDIGRNTDLLGFGIMAYAMTTCRVMRETLEVWGLYSEQLLGMMSRIEVGDDENGDMALTVIEPAPTSPIFVFCIEEMFAMMCANGKAMSGTLPRLGKMELPYPPPAYRAKYEALFECPITFNGDRARVTIARDWLNLPLLANDDNFHRLCLEHCSQILHRIAHSSPVAARLREAFLASPRSIPDLETAARLLKMSTRTFKRRLRQEGHSYQSLVRDFRADLARKYLLETDMRAKEIGYLLGFDEVHYFRRVFKAWTGQTVNQYRAAALRQR